MCHIFFFFYFTNAIKFINHLKIYTIHEKIVSKDIYDNNGKYNRLTMNNVKHVHGVD